PATSPTVPGSCGPGRHSQTLTLGEHLFADSAYDRLRIIDDDAYLKFLVEIVDPKTRRVQILPRRWPRQAHLRMDDVLATLRDYEQRIDVSHAMTLVAMGGNLSRRNAHP